MSGQERCGNCKFWLFVSDVNEDSDKPSPRGVCRKSPPVFVGEHKDGSLCQFAHPNDWSQPWQFETGWCGEWQPAPATTKES